MKNFKIFLIILVMVFIPICLTACKDNNTTQPLDTKPARLDSPELLWVDSTIKWNCIENASKYEIVINDKVIYTYNNYIDIEVNTQIKNYKVKVKSISENNNYLNSDFSQELEFNTIKLYKPQIYILINNESHTVTVNWTTNNRLADSYKFIINDNEEKIVSVDEIFITEDEHMKNLIENYIECSYTLQGELFDVGNNTIKIQAQSDNKYYLSSEVSNSYAFYKNPQYTNIRVENGLLKYGENSIYNTEIWDAITPDYDFPVINKENTPNYTSISDNRLLWSDPVYVNIYKIHSPKIVEHNINQNKLELTIQGYDPQYVGNENKSILGYDYNKLKVIVYTSAFSFTYYVDSKCLDIEKIIVDLSTNNISPSNVRKIELVAMKENYISSKIVEYRLK
ncbi:MAG: hypothetical protein IJA61_03490 [Clostridia bacterium]|nr:hypothetical protein [Clostridia bacterium]